MDCNVLAQGFKFVVDRKNINLAYSSNRLFVVALTKAIMILEPKSKKEKNKRNYLQKK